MNTNDAGRKDAREIIEELGWPSDIPVERLAASVFDRAMRAGVIEGEVILGYVFDRGEFGSRVTRENRLMVAVYGLLHFLADRDRIDELRFDGTLVSDEIVGSDEWTAASPRLPSMYGLYEAARDEWNRAKAGEAIG